MKGYEIGFVYARCQISTFCFNKITLSIYMLATVHENVVETEKQKTFKKEEVGEWGAIARIV